jgi:hypothetical protein
LFPFILLVGLAVVFPAVQLCVVVRSARYVIHAGREAATACLISGNPASVNFDAYWREADRGVHAPLMPLPIQCGDSWRKN